MPALGRRAIQTASLAASNCPALAALSVILMGLGVAEVIAHELRHKAAETLNGLRHAFLAGRNDLAKAFRGHAG
jgi:hypothetical protein